MKTSNTGTEQSCDTYIENEPEMLKNFPLSPLQSLVTCSCFFQSPIELELN